jgi:hypothetical protein
MVLSDSGQYYHAQLDVYFSAMLISKSNPASQFRTDMAVQRLG